MPERMPDGRPRSLWSMTIGKALLAVAVLALLVFSLHSWLDARPGSALGVLGQLTSAAMGGAVAYLLMRYSRRTAMPAALQSPMIPERRETHARGRLTPPSAAAIGQRATDAARAAPADPIAQYLRDVRDWAHADEAVFWRLDERAQVLRPAAWSTVGAAAPAFFQDPQWSELLQWSAEQRIVHFDAAGSAPVFAAAPVERNLKGVGALSIVARHGLAQSRDEAKLWLPRFATHVAQLTELVDTARRVNRESERTRSLLEKAHEFQNDRDVARLGRSICTSALSMTEGTRVAIVRWFDDEERGELQVVSKAHPVAPGLCIDPESSIGAACAGREPIVWEDARNLARVVVYGRAEPARSIGSLAVIPFVPHDLTGRVTGALVIEADRPGGIRADDVRDLRALAMLAALALDAAWAADDALRTSRLDKLTGLQNRGAFDDAFESLLGAAATDGSDLSLIIADVDFFKKVNDTHGHDAGDMVLRAVAAAIRDSVREDDVCARFGGEELAVILPGAPAHRAREAAERMRQAVEGKVITVAGETIAVTASFGVATFPTVARTRDTLFAAADRALYRAKRDGRNCVRSIESTAAPAPQ